MFTLPVKTWQHIVSKLIVAMVWIMLNTLVTFGSILIMLETPGLWAELVEAFNVFQATFGVAGYFIIPAYMLISLAFGILMIYAAIALGHLFTKHKLIASFAMYCVLYIISQTVIMLCILLFGIPFFHSMEPAAAPINGFTIFFLLPLLALAIGFFILTNVILSRKLNLE